MLPKTKRLTKKDFLGLRPKVVFRGTYVDIAIMEASETKFACVVSKKRIKRAVDRNKVKRKVYHILHTITLAHPLFVVVYPKHTVVASAYKNIEEEIRAASATL
jgi:ribonuclease P protein component